MIQSRKKRVLLALGLAFVPAVLFVVLFGFDILDESINALGVSGLGAAVFGILDFFLYLLVDTDGNGGKIGSVLKNVLFYLLMIAQVLVAFIVSLDHAIGQEIIMDNLDELGGVGAIAFRGVATFSVLFKWLAYLLITNDMLLPQEALPYVSLGSMLLGYLFSLILTLIGLSSLFVMQWVPFIVFMASLLSLVVFNFKNGAIFDEYGNGGGYSGSSAGKYRGSGSGYSSGGSSSSSSSKPKNYDTSAWLAISEEVSDYCDTLCRTDYRSGTLKRIELEVSYKLDTDSYYVTLHYSVTFVASDFRGTQAEVSRRESQIKNAVASYESSLSSRVNDHKRKVMSIIERVLTAKHPTYNGKYGVDADYDRKLEIE